VCARSQEFFGHGHAFSSVAGKLVAGPSDPAASGQALGKILREEICTPRMVDCGHQV